MSREIFTNQDNWQKGICLTRGWRNLARRQICKIFSSNISDSPPNLSIEFNQKDENLSKFQHKGKPSKPRVYSHRLKPFIVNSKKYVVGILNFAIFNFALPRFGACKKKVLETSGFASVCHFLPPPGQRSWNFPELSGCDCNKRSKRKGRCRWLNG